MPPHPFPHLRPPERLVAILLFCAYAFAAVFLVLYGARHLADHSEERLKRAGELASALAVHADRMLSEAERELQIIALLLERERSWPPRADAIHGVLREMDASSSPLRHLLVLDAEGRSIGDATALPARPFNGADRDYFRHHRANPGGKALVGHPVRSRFSGQWTIPISRPLADAQGRFRGVVVAALDTDYLDAIGAALKHDPLDRIALIGADAVVYYADGMPDSEIGQAVPEWNAAARAHFSGGGLHDGVLRDYIAQPLEHSGLTLAVGSTPPSNPAAVAAVMAEIAPGVLILLLLISGTGIYLLRHSGRAERQLRDIADTIPGMLYRLRLEPDGNVRFLWGSQPAERSLGVDSASLLTDTRAFGLHRDDAARCRDALLAAARRGRDITLEGRRHLPDGSLRHWRATARPMPDAGGWLFDGVLFDITEERRAAEAVQTSERQLAMVLDAAKDAIVTLDGALRVVHYNKGAERLFGVPAAEMLGQGLDRLLPEAVRGRHDAMMQQMLDGPDGAREMGNWRKVRGLRKDGTEFPLLSSISKVTLPDGSGMLCAIMRDMTDVATSERQLTDLSAQQGKLLALAEQANLAKAKFLATMSHELRTPLNAIIGFSEAIEQQIYGPIGSERYKGYVRDILGSGRHLLEIINDILDLTKIQQHGTDFRFERLDPRDVIDEALIFVVRKAAEKGISVDVICEIRQPEVVADQRALRQILANLLGNAVKFTPGGGSVQVSLREQAGSWLAIQVDDTGPGVAPEILTRLGDPFVQDRDIYAGDNTGTGLGLAIVRELMTAHNGRVRFSNRAAGGFSACIELPLQPQPAMRLPAAP